ncbi:MAG: phosphatase [Betaproteobacteria bacterium]|nr:phosphatase [Betaproteobacteria bacterium]
MESLALLAAFIVAIAVIGGPASLFFVYLLRRYRRAHLRPSISVSRIYIFLILIFAVPAILVGMRLLTLNLGVGGSVIGLIGVVTGSWAIFKLTRKQ